MSKHAHTRRRHNSIDTVGSVKLNALFNQFVSVLSPQEHDSLSAFVCKCNIFFSAVNASESKLIPGETCPVCPSTSSLTAGGTQTFSRHFRSSPQVSTWSHNVTNNFQTKSEKLTFHSRRASTHTQTHTTTSSAQASSPSPSPTSSSSSSFTTSRPVIDAADLLTFTCCRSVDQVCRCCRSWWLEAGLEGADS